MCENLFLVLILIRGRPRAKCTRSMLPQSWVAYQSCLFTTHLTSNFQLVLFVQCSTSQFSALFLPTPHGDSSLTNCVPNPLDGESDKFISTDSKGYIETEVEWFDEPHIVNVSKWVTSKRSKAVTIEVSLWCIFLPHTNHLSLEAPLGWSNAFS